MNETRKTNKLRSSDFFTKYLAGRVIDIGCGGDPVVPHAEGYDTVYGHADAGQILKYRDAESYDCVYSSHCLEHMENVPEALRQWWGLVKPGGFMVLVVPDEDFYEQGIWPSRFNPDHKATFRLHPGASWSPVSYNIKELVENLSKADVISTQSQTEGYLHFLKSHGGLKRRPLLVSKAGSFLKRIVRKMGWKSFKLKILLDWIAGVPVDQTLGNALAQIEVIVRKRKTTETRAVLEAEPNSIEAP